LHTFAAVNAEAVMVHNDYSKVVAAIKDRLHRFMLMGASPLVVFDGEEYLPKAETGAARRQRRADSLAAAKVGNLPAKKKARLLAAAVRDVEVQVLKDGDGGDGRRSRV
jgi:hypothetical protein